MQILSLILFFFVSVAKTQYFFNNYPTNRASIRGYLLNDEPSVLPFGSRIIVSLADVSLQDAPARPLNTFVLYGSYRFPIPYEIPYSITQVQGSNPQQYTIQARIEKDGQLLYINDQYTPVRLIPIPINPVNILMKKINGGIYPTRAPSISAMYICQLRPEPGFCYASFEQFYFNVHSRSCQTFIWGGCGGNANRFSSRDECERTCSIYRRRILNTNAKQVPITY